MTREGLRGSSDRSVLVLMSLAGGPKHGYALIKDIDAFAAVKMSAGALYAVLSKLEASGLIVPVPSSDRRQPYRLTSQGADALRAQLTRSAHLASVGLARLEGRFA